MTYCDHEIISQLPKEQSVYLVFVKTLERIEILSKPKQAWQRERISDLETLLVKQMRKEIIPTHSVSILLEFINAYIKCSGVYSYNGYVMYYQGHCLYQNALRDEALSCFQGYKLTVTC